MASNSLCDEPLFVDLTEDSDPVSTPTTSDNFEHGLCSELTECTDKMELTMEAITRKQEKNGKYLKSLKSNLKTLKLTFAYFLKYNISNYKMDSASSSQKSSQQFLKTNLQEEEFIYEMHQLRKTDDDHSDHKQDCYCKTSKEFINLVLDDIESDATKLDENVVAVKEAQSRNLKHLKKLKKSLKETEKYVKQLELKIAQLKTADVQTQNDSQSKRCREESDDENIAKKIKVEKESAESDCEKDEKNSIASTIYMEKSEPPRGLFSHSSPDSQGSNPEQEAKHETDANIIHSEERSEPSSEMEHILTDAEKISSEMRKKLNAFEDIMRESRRILNDLELDINSVWMNFREQQRKNQVEEAAADFNIRIQQEMHFPTCSSQSIPIARRTIRFTPIKSYLDAHSENAQIAINSTCGPLTPDQLTSFLIEVKGKKQNIRSLVLQFTENVDGLLQQLLSIKSHLDESYKLFVRTPGTTSGEFDQRLQNRLPKLIQNIELCFIKGTTD